jgi:hypothetical protein
MADAVISPNPRSIARVFADVNHKKGREYWDYEQLNVSFFLFHSNVTFSSNLLF